MKEYRCSWAIDVSAENPRAAAEAAERLMGSRMQSTWNVTDHETCAVAVEVKPERPMPRYRFILTTYSSRADVYGNRSHFARLVSTITGKSIRFGAHSEGNARMVVGLALADLTGHRSLSEVCYTVEVDDMPIRQHASLRNDCTYSEGDITPELLQELETI